MSTWLAVTIVMAIVIVAAIPPIARARALLRHGDALLETHGAANDPRY